MSDLPVLAQSLPLVPVDPDAEAHLVDYLFSFTDPATLGHVLQQRGYTPDFELGTLLDIVMDPEGSSKLKLAAIAMLQDRRTKALEQSGSVAQRTARTTIDGITIEEHRTQRVVSSLQSTIKLREITDVPPQGNDDPREIPAGVGQPPGPSPTREFCIPGDHQPPDPAGGSPTPQLGKDQHGPDAGGE